MQKYFLRSSIENPVFILACHVFCRVPKRQVSMDEHVDRQKERSRDKKLSVKVTIDARSDKRRTLPPASKSERTVEKSKPKDDSRTVVHMDSEVRMFHYCLRLFTHVLNVSKLY